MEDCEKKFVVMSGESIMDIDKIRIYSEETFGERKADEYYQCIMDTVKSLDKGYLMHAECLQLETKRKIYRRVILNSHILIYRIAEKIEILRIFHSASCDSKIRSARVVKI